MNKLVEYPKKAFNLIWGGIVYDPAVLWAYLVSFVTGTKPIHLIEMSESELIDALKDGKSLIRFGDGEAMLMTGRSIHYQIVSKDLATELKEILKQYSESSNYAIGIPIEELGITDEELKQRQRLRIWRLFRVLVKKRINPKAKYYRAAYFYHKDIFKNKIAPIFKNRHAICVTRASTMNERFRNTMKDQFAESSFVVSPDKNAYTEKGNLISEINQAIASQPTLKPIIFLAAGPASKVIAFHYAEQGIQALDIGHGMEIIATGEDYSGRI